MKFVSLFLLSAVLLSAAISGRILDSASQPIEAATIEFRTTSNILLHTTRSQADGSFSWPDSPSSPLQIRVSTNGFTMRELVQNPTATPIDIQLEPTSQYTRLTVTASRGGVEESASLPQLTTILAEQDLAKRPLSTLGNALENVPGVFVQQTSTAQVSPFLRGLTGYQVLNLMDGIRFNNSTFRSGPNQYLAFIEPSQAQRVEAILGPTGVQYGSDSLGGSIHVSTLSPEFNDTWQTHGAFSLSGATADLSGLASARLSASNDKLFWLLGGSGRSHNDLRAGGGIDSRNVYTRLFGISPNDARNFLGSRQQDTGFQQYGLESKLAIRPTLNQILTFNFQRGAQFNSRNYKDLNGGLGRLTSDFSPQTLNWFYSRYEILNVSRFDSLSSTFSVNQQTDGTRRQNLLDSNPITNDRNRVNVFGYTGQAATHFGSRLFLSFGGEFYDEHIASQRNVLNPVTNALTQPRPLYPDGSRYGTIGLFTQANYQISRKLRAAGGIRSTNVRFADRVNTLWFRDTTFHASLRYDPLSVLGFHIVASRGFRAPNLNDIGALGINDLGYEIPSSEAIPAGAILSTNSGESAESKNQPLRALAAESLMNYEAGFTLRSRRWTSRLQAFNADLTDPIVRRTLLFPAANPPSTLAGLPVTVIPPTAAQRNQGVVTVATALDPRAVKAFVNDGASRYYGLESLTSYRFTNRLLLDGNYTYIVGRDLNPNRNIRRLPPQMGTVTLRHTPSGRRPWTELTFTAAGAQSRLSGGDLDDERIGASRRRQDIAAFFNSTMASQFIDPASRTFRPTGETLLQIQNRVLPGLGDGVRVPLYRSTAAWTNLSFRTGLPLTERLRLMAALENILDRNYRFHGSGMDSPGTSLYLNLSYRF